MNDNTVAAQLLSFQLLSLKEIGFDQEFCMSTVEKLASFERDSNTIGDLLKKVSVSLSSLDAKEAFLMGFFTCGFLCFVQGLGEEGKKQQ